MPIYSVQAPNGKIYDVQGPEGATVDQLAQAIQQSGQYSGGTDVVSSAPGIDIRMHYDDAQQAQNQANAPSGNATGGFLMGLRDPIDAGAQMLRRAVPNSIGNAVDNFGQWLHDQGLPVAPTNGVAGVDDLINRTNAGYEANRADAGRGGIDWARMGGNILGSAPIIAASGGTSLGADAPLLGRLAAGAAQGGLLGAFSPVIGDSNQADFAQQKTNQGLLGGALGTATTPIAGILGRTISPVASRGGTQAGLLANEGVNLTPGQIAGGTLMRAEDRLMSVPILGDAIRAARTRANDQFNTAVYNRVLAPLGGSTTKIGRAAVDDVSNQVSQAYDDVLKNVQFSADNGLQQDLANITNVARGLPDAERNSLMATIQKEILDPLSMGQSVDGQTFKNIESQLGQRALRFSRSTDAHQQDVGDALREAQRAVRDSLARQNPQAADQLGNVNQAFSMLTRLQGAASKVGATDGVFTPAQFTQAVRAGDMTVRKNAFARGNASMQDLADAGKSVMSSTIPNSGTADRLLLDIGALGSYAIHPAIPLSLLGASVPYLPGAEKAIPYLMTNRPAGAQAIARGLQSLPPGLLGALTNTVQ